MRNLRGARWVIGLGCSLVAFAVGGALTLAVLVGVGLSMGRVCSADTWGPDACFAGERWVRTTATVVSLGPGGATLTFSAFGTPVTARDVENTDTSRPGQTLEITFERRDPAHTTRPSIWIEEEDYGDDPTLDGLPPVENSMVLPGAGMGLGLVASGVLGVWLAAMSSGRAQVRPGADVPDEWSATLL